MLALLLNKKCVKGKRFWRVFPILAYAVPGFITLLGFKFMFSYGGPLNFYIKAFGGSAIGFLDRHEFKVNFIFLSFDIHDVTIYLYAFRHFKVLEGFFFMNKTFKICEKRP